MRLVELFRIWHQQSRRAREHGGGHPLRFFIDRRINKTAVNCVADGHDHGLPVRVRRSKASHAMVANKLSCCLIELQQITL